MWQYKYLHPLRVKTVHSCRRFTPQRFDHLPANGIESLASTRSAQTHMSTCCSVYRYLCSRTTWTQAYQHAVRLDTTEASLLSQGNDRDYGMYLRNREA